MEVLKNRKYRQVSLKKQMIDTVEDYIETHPEEKFKSIAAFVKQAIREKIHRDSIRSKQYTFQCVRCKKYLISRLPLRNPPNQCPACKEEGVVENVNSFLWIK